MKGKLLSRDGLSSSSRIRREVLKRSRRQEASVSKRLGGARVSGSGNQWHDKADVKTATLLVECKRTDKKQFILTKAMLQVHQIQSLKCGKKPVFQLEIGAEKWAVIRWDHLEQLLEVDDEPCQAPRRVLRSEDEEE